jgi:SAM-dependent methyltransferase
MVIVSYKLSAAVYDAVHESRKDYRSEAQRVHEVIQTRKSAGGSALLDVGCGTGLHGQYLEERYEFEGLDSSPEMLTVARRRLPDANFHQASMTDFDLGRQYGAVTCLFSAIGHCRSLQEMRAAVFCMASHVAPGGVLVVEPGFLRDRWIPGPDETNFLRDKGIARIIQARREGDLALLETHYFVDWPDNPRYLYALHEIGLFTAEEYAAAFIDSGLVVQHDDWGLTGRGLFIGHRCQTLGGSTLMS